MKNTHDKWPLLIKSSDKINLYISNISGKVHFYFDNSKLIPLFININSKCWIASLNNFDLLYKHALQRLRYIKPIKTFIIKFFLILRFIPGKLANVDHCVFFNHNMMSTTLWPKIRNISSILSKLIVQYPNHPIIFRSLNYVHNKKLLKDLTKKRFKLLRIREVALFDPKKKFTKNQRRHLKVDMNLLNSSEYQIIKPQNLDTSDVSRIYELYTKIYIEKYSNLNPQYTELFFSSILNNPKYEIFLLKKDNKIDAFALFEREGNVIQCPCLGYDNSLPQKLGLYRQMGAVLDNYCIENNLLSNESSGVYKFKQIRGCELTSEYYAIYYKHLSLTKRFCWFLYIYFSNRIPKIN